MIPIIEYSKQNKHSSFLKRKVLENDVIENAVSEILKNVKQNGDKAVQKYTASFDGYNSSAFLVTTAEFTEAENQISDTLKQAIQNAYDNIYKFHLSQRNNELPVLVRSGVKCWRKSIPIQKVGFYIPGGTAPLFSTVLMLAVPAGIAGCTEKIICTPCNSAGEINPAILYTAKLCGIEKIFKVGGAQAIAAMAYGTETIPGVHKIFGPGNQYVTCAKQLVQKEGIAIDIPAGPSEVAILADQSANPAFVAADMLSQAEHGTDSQAVLVTNSKSIINSVQQELEKQLAVLPRKDIASKALQNSCMVLVANLAEGIELLNEYAPEHLILSVDDAPRYADKVINAGSVFLGNYSPESAGDYASGTNHTLPTNAFAKAYSGVSLDSFIKKITFQEITPEGLRHLSASIIEMAEAEGLQAHANAVKIRL